MVILRVFKCVEMGYISHVRSEKRVLDAFERRLLVNINCPSATASRGFYCTLIEKVDLGGAHEAKPLKKGRSAW